MKRKSARYQGSIYPVFRIAGPYVTLIRGNVLIGVMKNEVEFL